MLLYEGKKTPLSIKSFSLAVYVDSQYSYP